MRTQKIIKIGFTIILLILLVNAWFSYRAVESLNRNYQQVQQANLAIRQIEATHNKLEEAEVAHRHYFITVDEAAMEPYRKALQKVQEHFTTLERTLTGQPEQQELFLSLRKIADKKIADMQSVLDVLQRQGREAALGEIKIGRGIEDSRRLRDITEQMVGIEQHHLSRLQDEAITGRRRALATFTYASLFALLLVGAVYLLLTGDVTQKQKNARALREANELLEQRVEQRTQELQTANITMVEEISERKRAEEKLEILNRELERSNRELQDFAFVASHDLQEPLRKIQAFGDRLKSKYGSAMPDDASDYLERMQNAARRMHILINDLLAFSRITTKAQPFALINLEDIAHEVVNDLDGRLMQTNGRVEIAPLPEIEAEPLQMRQLLQNLIGNALKFHRPDESPRVTVSSRILPAEEAQLVDSKAEEVCELRVADNGTGFDEKYLDRIFTPFQRLHARSEYEGTGMGLAVCRKIVERHSGTINAESRVGVGSTFIVRLPMTQNQEVTQGVTQ